MKTTSRHLIKYVFSILGLNLFITGSVLIIGYLSLFRADLKETLILSALFSVISLLTFSIFLRGLTREPDSQTLHTMVAISLKFLMDIVLALVWFFIFKKTSPASVVIFFVIYLTLTLFIIFFILKILRDKSL